MMELDPKQYVYIVSTEGVQSAVNSVNSKDNTPGLRNSISMFAVGGWEFESCNCPESWYSS